MSNLMSWYNYDTKAFDYRTMPQTVDEALPYIDTCGMPNGGPARGMFRILVEHKGMDIPHALIEVYTRLTTKPEDKK